MKELTQKTKHKPTKTEIMQALFRNSALAMVFEANSEKPGNVTPTKPFKNMSFETYIYNSIVIAEKLSELASYPRVRVGKTILNSVEKMVRTSGKGVNTHLGTILLLAPLCAAYTNAYHKNAYPISSQKIKDGVKIKNVISKDLLRDELKVVLNSLDYKDSIDIFHAVNRANASGLTDVEKLDVRDANTLKELKTKKIPVKAWFAEGIKDNGVCYEYLTDYSLSFDIGWKALHDGLGKGLSISHAIVADFIEILSRFPDNLIMGKCGRKVAEDTSKRASEIISLGSVYTKEGRNEIENLDKELRAKNANPGTTADIICSTLFIAFASGLEI